MPSSHCGSADLNACRLSAYPGESNHQGCPAGLVPAVVARLGYYTVWAIWMV